MNTLRARLRRMLTARKGGLLMALGLLLVIAVPALAQVGGGYSLAWSRVVGGAVSSTGGGFALSGVVGPPGPGALSGGGYALLPVGGPTAVNLHFSPDPATVGSGGSPTDVRVLLEAGFQQVDAVQLRILFDPALLQVVDADANVAGVQITPGSAFQQVLSNTVDSASGSITFAAGRATSQSALTGTIDLATISIAATSGLTQSVTTSLTFDPAGIEVAFAGQALAKVLDDGAVHISMRRLAFGRWPIRAAHGYPFGLQPRVALQDTSGITLTADSSTVVTLTIKPGTGASGAVLTCDQSSGGAASTGVLSGTATFSGCQIDRPGAGYVLEAVAAGATAAQTAAFNVTLAGDTNGDARASIADYSLVVTHFGKSSASTDWRDATTRPWRADLDGDEAVDVVDHSIIVTRFGTSTTAAVTPSDPSAGP